MKTDIVANLLSHPYYQGYSGNFDTYPIISKKEAQIISSMSRGDFVARTSGSSGVFLNVKWNKQDYFVSNSYLWKLRKRYGVKPSDIYVTNHAVLYDKELYPCVHSIIVRNNCISLSKTLLDEANLKKYVEILTEKNPTFLMLQPSFALILGQYAKKHNVDITSKLKLIELTGEYLHSDVYCSLKKIYHGVPIHNLYGMQEFNGIAYGDDNELQVINDNVYVEILDDNGNKVPSRESGNIVVTGYSNSVMPLIRYKTGDIGRWIDEGHSIQLLVSKSNDLLSNNNVFYDGSVFLAITEKINFLLDEDISQFQYVLKNNILHCYFNIIGIDKGSTEQLDIIVKEQVRKHLKYAFDDILVFVNNNIPYISTEKIKYFINEDV